MAKSIKKEEFENRIQKRFPTEKFEIINYINLSKPLKIKCLNCNNIIEINVAGNFLAKNKRYGCLNCHGLWRDRELKINKIKEKYDIINTFIKETHTYYHVKCKECGHERTTTLNNFIKHLDCGCVTKVYRNRTGQEFINEANQYYNNELELIGEYKDQLTKVLLKHKPCGFIWSVRPADIIHGQSHCPKCRTQQSLGSKKIERYLKEKEIEYLIEYPLKDSKQRFDFFLPQYNIAIEYNGKQHYEYIKFFHKTLEGFEQYKMRDLKKEEYCKNNNIKLIKISYKEDNLIATIIDDIISSTTKVGQVSEKATLL